MCNVTLFMNYYYNILNELFSEDVICYDAVKLTTHLFATFYSIRKIQNYFEYIFGSGKNNP